MARRSRIRLARPSRRARLAARIERLPRVAIIGIAVVLVVGVAAIVTAVSIGVVAAVQSLTSTPPGLGTRIAVAAEAKSAKAAAAGGLSAEQLAATQYLSEQPTVYWMTPEHDPQGEASTRIISLANESRAQKADLAIAIYGLPARDCDGHSAGGLSEDAYVEWVHEIAVALAAVRDVRKIVVLEPDSLAQAPSCGNIDDRVRQLRQAIDALAAQNTWIYVDGGHSNWLPADQMADLIARLDRSGTIRGFATNVSNYNDTSAEFTYAHAVAARLGGWAHALIDTSRNGNGSTGEWCNPAGRLVGSPGGTYADDVVDTNLWIKPPGESDGPCNGGPAAGTWWPAAAVELTRNARG